MAKIIGVRFKDVGKIYYFTPNNIEFTTDDYAIVETSRGIECGNVVINNREIEDSEIVSPLKNVIRKADKNDIKTFQQNKQKEQDAMPIFQSKVAHHKLNMKLIDVEYTFDCSKVIFYFTADGRVNFRELVKDLAFIFKTRIELRQIGVRDESKLLGGLGICGRPFCCSTFLGDFHPVSIKMAKEQGLSLNPVKISGTCGRLMCCLKYEQNAYEDLLAVTPKVGAVVKTPDGVGDVIETNLLTGKLTVKLNKKPDTQIKSFNKTEVTLIKDAQIRLNKKEIASLKELE